LELAVSSPSRECVFRDSNRLKPTDEFKAFKKRALEMQNKTGRPLLSCYEKLAKQRGHKSYADYISRFPDSLFNNQNTFTKEMGKYKELDQVPFKKKRRQ